MASQMIMLVSVLVVEVVEVVELSICGLTWVLELTECLLTSIVGCTAPHSLTVHCPVP